MTQFLKAAALAATLAPATLVPGAAGADSITLDAPMTGDSLQSTGVDMSVYYIALEGSAYEVVATYVGRDGKADPQRLIMALRDGDTVRFGLPGRMETRFAFARDGAEVTVSAAPVARLIAGHEAPGT